MIVEPLPGPGPRYTLAELLAQWGDIYLVSLDPAAGHEQQGTRPVLIVSPAPFNRLTKTPVVLPITRGGNVARTAGFAVRGPSTWRRATGASWRACRRRPWLMCSCPATLLQ